MRQFLFSRHSSNYVGVAYSRFGFPGHWLFIPYTTIHMRRGDGIDVEGGNGRILYLGWMVMDLVDNRAGYVNLIGLSEV